MSAVQRWTGVCLLVMGTGAFGADAPYLVGIHWWGYISGQPIDTAPATLLDLPTYPTWDVETITTHSDAWWRASHFLPLYQVVYGTYRATIITRIDYTWGDTVPAPADPNYAGWPASVVSSVSVLRNQCHIWLIGNEPNLYMASDSRWPERKVTPVEYAQIYRAVRSAIHSSAGASPAGAHIVLFTPISPGAEVPGVRWKSGTAWLAEALAAVPVEEIDGFAIHAYGGDVNSFRQEYTSQLSVIDAAGHHNKPVYLTEWCKRATPGDAAAEAAAADFCRASAADVHAWNQTPGNHDIVSMCWYVYDVGDGAYARSSLEYWRDNGNPRGSAGDLYTAFEWAVDQRYPAGQANPSAYTPTPSVPVSPSATPTATVYPSGMNLALTAANVRADSVYTPSQSERQAVDGNLSTKWTSTATTAQHWLAVDLGAQYSVTGYVVRHAGAGGEPTSYNTEQFTIQSGPSMDGPWTVEFTGDNTPQRDIDAFAYGTPKPLRYVRLHITDAGIDNHARIPEFEVYGNPGSVPTGTPTATSTGPTNTPSPLAVTEPFESMPTWSSAYEATWGGTATWSIVAGGQSGNFLRSSYTVAGSSSRVLVYTVPTQSRVTVTIYMRCPSHAGSYWMETALRLGNSTAAQFDAQPTDWTMIQKFSSSGTNGNGDQWTRYSAQIDTGTVGQISIGLKIGSGQGASPVVGWDSLQLTAAALVTPTPSATVPPATPTATHTATLASTPTPSRTPTPTALADLDGDTLADSLEGAPPATGQTHRWLPDSDGDGLLDGTEDANRNGQRDPSETDGRNRDTDGDGLMDGIEIRVLRTDPLSPASPASYVDQDRDGLPASVDVFDTAPDWDGDRFLDGYEAAVLSLDAAYDPRTIPRLGDPDLNGYVSNVDALIVQSLFLGLVTPAAPIFQGSGFGHADPNRDGQISNVDALIVQSFFLFPTSAVLPAGP